MNVRIRSGTGAAAVATVLGLSALWGVGPAAAETNSGLSISKVSATAGQVSFILTGPGLPDAAALAPGAVVVSAAGTPLETTVESAAGKAPDELPIRGVVLVVDTGSTMAGSSLDNARTILSDYVDQLPAEVAIAVVSSADSGSVVEPLTGDRDPIATAIAGLAVGTSSTLNDALLLATGEFDSTYAAKRMVVLTDGTDQTSTASLAEVTSALAASDIALDLVELGENDQVDLASVASNSGGDSIDVPTSAEVSEAVATLRSSVSAPLAVAATVPTTLSGEEVTLAVSVTTGSSTLAATAAVSLADEPVILTDRETVRLRVLPMVILYLAMALVSLAVIIVGFLIVAAILGRSATRERRRQLERISGKRPVQMTKEEEEGSALMRTALAVSDRAVARKGKATIEVELERAGIVLRPSEWMLVRAMTACVVAALLALAIPWYFGLIVGIPGGWFLSNWYRKQRTARRQRKFGDLLPEALQLVVGALRSGFSLLQALDAVVREGPEPVASEFGRALAEARLGGEVEQALERTAERNSSEDLSWLVMAVRIQREVGGNLSEVVATAVETMRERGRLFRHVRALSAEGRLSAYILVGMPLALTGWMFAFRGEYIKPLYTETLGLVILAGGVLMIVAGAFWISRLIKVEV